MGIRDLFRRKSNLVVDLGAMQKKGIIKIDKEESESVQSGGYADLSKGEQTGGAFDFFGAIASSAGSEDETSSSMSSSSSEIKARVESISQRLSKLMDRVELLEKKMDRVEGRY